MHNLVQQFPDQLQDALSLFTQIDFSPITDRKYSNIVCAWLGWSGIAASLIQSLGQKYMSIPYVITKSYELPACTSQDSLFLACSHSGNTEETIEALKSAYETGAMIVVISSGGWMTDFAREKWLFLIQLPSGMMPRACYTYAVVAQLLLLEKMWYLTDIHAQIENVIAMIHAGESEYKAQATALANTFYQHIPVLYSDDMFAPVAMRFRQQLNENSKILCWHAIIPEMNHNEVLGRKDNYPQCIPLFLRHSAEHPRTAYRMELTTQIVSPKVSTTVEVRGTGETIIEQMLTMTYILDRVSVYLADLNGVDPTEISTINFLKNKLAEKN